MRQERALQDRIEQKGRRKKGREGDMGASGGVLDIVEMSPGSTPAKMG
jgi:hypothetical protein